jgi:hypothetical protein
MEGKKQTPLKSTAFKREQGTLNGQQGIGKSPLLKLGDINNGASTQYHSGLILLPVQQSSNTRS